MVKHQLSRNWDQLRQIFHFYAETHEPRRIGSGVGSDLMSFDNCQEMFKDFGVLPQICDLSTLHRLFLTCKLWEWSLAFLLHTHLHASMAGHSNLNRSPSSDVSDGKRCHFGSRNSFAEAFSNPIPSTYTHLLPLDSEVLALAHTHDFVAGMGNFSLTLYGFIELLARISVFGGKLGSKPLDALTSLLRLMNATDATSKIFKGANRHSTRKSMPVRKFLV